MEDWLIARTRAEETTQFLHVPSLPFAYSSGKLGDWYPDLLDKRLASSFSISPRKAANQAGSRSTRD